MKNKSVIVLLEPIYSTYEPLKSIELLLKKIEIKFIILPQIKKIMETNNVQIFSSDEQITSIVINNGLKNVSEIKCNWTFDAQKKSREMTDKLDKIWSRKEIINFNGKNFSSVLKCGVIWDIHELLSQFMTYNCLITRENVEYVYTENEHSLTGKIIKSSSDNLKVGYSSIYPNVYGKFRNFLETLMKFKGFKSYFKGIGLYIYKNTNVRPEAVRKKLLVDATYKNYLNNIIPVIENEHIKKEFDVYFLSQKKDLMDKNIDFNTVKKFRFSGRQQGTKKILDDLFDNSDDLNEIFDYDNINLQWLKNELYFSIKNKLPFLLKKMEIAERIIESLSPDIILIGDDRSEITRSGILPAKQKHIPILEIQHGSYSLPKLMITPISNKICVWGEYTQKVLLEAEMDEKYIEITGCPCYDILLNKSRNWNKPQNEPKKSFKILFATQPIYKDINLKIIGKIGSFISKSDEFILLIKPHPLENKDVYKDFSKKFPNNIFIKNNSEDITDMLIDSDVLMTISSTVGLEAALLDKPVIGINFDSKKSIYTSSDIAIEVTNIEELLNSIIKIKSDNELNKKLSEARTKFVYEQTYLKDNKASERIAKIIIDYCSKY